MICKFCNSDLCNGIYAVIDGQLYKVCPPCSAKEGQHIFYRCPQEFGYRGEIIQSYCTKCRGGGNSDREGSITCAELEKKGIAPITDIRFLPMSKEVFPTKKSVYKFLEEEMPDRGNTYYYKTKHNFISGTLILFQWGGTIVGLAEYEKTEDFTEIRDGYKGEYKFRNGSIKSLVRPITADEYVKIDSTFHGFNQSARRTGLSKFTDLFILLQDRIKETENIKELDEERIFINQLNALEEPEVSGQYKHIRYPPKEAVKTNKGYTYPRDPKVAYNALKIAGHQCEFEPGHSSFPRKKDGLPYMEPHHLVPLAYYNKMDCDIDREQNIVSLCSECHNRIHYGRDKDEMLERLYSVRKKLLEEIGIYMSLEELKDLYK